jgi:hypothetical protein
MLGSEIEERLKDKDDLDEWRERRRELQERYNLEEAFGLPRRIAGLLQF